MKDITNLKDYNKELNRIESLRDEYNQKLSKGNASDKEFSKLREMFENKRKEVTDNYRYNKKDALEDLNKGSSVKVKSKNIKPNEFQKLSSDLGNKLRGDLSLGKKGLNAFVGKGLKAIPLIGPALGALSMLGSENASAGEMLEDELTGLIPGGVDSLGKGSDEIPVGAKMFTQTPEEQKEIQMRMRALNRLGRGE